MKVFCVFGVSKSGKTTTVEKIIGELKKRGYRVGSVKDIHNENFKIDTEGTNTWRHRKAGAEMVIARGMAETDVLIPERLKIVELLKWFDHDFVIIEGGHEESFPKILTAKNSLEIDERLNESVFAISGVVSGQNFDSVCGQNVNAVSGQNGKAVPVINALTDIEKLTDLIELKAWESGRGEFV